MKISRLPKFAFVIERELRRSRQVASNSAKHMQFCMGCVLDGRIIIISGGGRVRETQHHQGRVLFAWHGRKLNSPGLFATQPFKSHLSPTQRHYHSSPSQVNRQQSMHNLLTLSLTCHPLAKQTKPKTQTQSTTSPKQTRTLRLILTKRPERKPSCWTKPLHWTAAAEWL